MVARCPRKVETDRVKRKLPKLLRDVALAVTSLAVGLAACELALRLWWPRYQLAANPPPTADERSVGRASSSSFHLVRNPDTGVQHRLSYNDLGARTSRPFTAESLASTVNVAFFGDSWTENIHMPVQYTFPEHLHWLLNHLATGWQPKRPAAKPRFNVLNFGAWGWGPAREYLRWRSMSTQRKFHHVFYVFHFNDVSNLKWAVRKGLISLDESGNMRRRGYSSPLWTRLIARLHLTYLAIDAWRRFAGQATADEHQRADSRDWNATLGKVVRHWKREVEAGGGRFHVVALHKRRFAKVGLPDLRDNLDMSDCFHADDLDFPDFPGRQWRFDNDRHWNPAANMVAASCLYRYLEDVLDLPPRTDEALAAARHTYYQAFLDSPSWEGERFAPAAPWRADGSHTILPPSPPKVPQAVGAAIVNHYLALELQPRPTARDVDMVASARAAGALASADWNVFANLAERLLVYAQAPCQVPRGGAAEPFFLHVYPFTREKLSEERRRYGFENLDHGPWMHAFTEAGSHRHMARDPDECVFTVKLPEWSVAHVRTGQFTKQDIDGKAVYNHHWEVDFAFPLARSVWDVYAAKGEHRILDYVKRPCPLAARQARFFLHVYPVRATDHAGFSTPYVNLDFQWNTGADRESGYYDATADTCRISAVLPNFPIATIHTGQFRDGLIDKRLWDAHIRLAEVERLAQQER